MYGDIRLQNVNLDLMITIKLRNFSHHESLVFADQEHREGKARCGWSWTRFMYVVTYALHVIMYIHIYSLWCSRSLA